MSYLLPDGTTTKSSEKYVKKWRAFAAPLLNMLGDAKLVAFDPDLCIQFNNRLIDFDVDVVKIIYANLKEEVKV